MKNLTLAAVASLTLLAIIPAKAQLIITEVDPTGSSTSTYAADWFELTNYGSSAIDLSGWKMDDNSNSFSLAVPMAFTNASNGTTIGAGQSVVFVESTGTTAAAVTAKFESAWFGSNVPANFAIGTYGGSGVGLGSGGDAVNVFNSTGTLEAGVMFGAATTNVSFDNAVAQITNTGSTDGTISTISVVGTNGAFTNAGGEIGSPGAVPEPSSGALAAIVATALGFFAWRRSKTVNA